MHKLSVLLLSAFCFLLFFAAAPQSYKQIAQEALMKGDHARAIEFYRKWTEADPTDAISLYNLACCYAIKQHPDDAVATLRKAAEAGWSDAGHTAQDPDLESLRARADYHKVLDAIAHNESSRSGGYTVLTCAEERVGRYVVVLPDEYDPNHSYPLLLLLHGYGQSPLEFAKVTALINSHDYIYAIPEGAYTAMDTDGKGFSHLREMDDYREDTASVSLAAAWIMRVAEDVARHYPVSGSKVLLAGFSQGAALAHVVAARYPERVLGYAAHGGYIIKDAITAPQLAAEKAQNLRVLITHCPTDPAVEFMEATYAVNMLKASGVDVTFAETTGNHVFDAEAAQKVGDWLKTLSK
jgi:predicted esterase